MARNGQQKQAGYYEAYREKLGRDRERRRQTVSDRMNERGMSVKRLAREMGWRGAPSASERNIRNYLKGGTNPPVEFFIVLSSVLGIPLDTLIERVSPDPTSDELKHAKALRGAAERGLTKGLPRYDELYRTPTDFVIGRSAGFHYRGMLRRAELLSEEPNVKETEKTSKALGRAVSAPLKELGVSPEELHIETFSYYTLAICTALGFVWKELYERHKLGQPIFTLIQRQKQRAKRKDTSSPSG